MKLSFLLHLLPKSNKIVCHGHVLSAKKENLYLSFSNNFVALESAAIYFLCQNNKYIAEPTSRTNDDAATTPLTAAEPCLAWSIPSMALGTARYGRGLFCQANVVLCTVSLLENVLVRKNDLTIDSIIT